MPYEKRVNNSCPYNPGDEMLPLRSRVLAKAWLELKPRNQATLTTRE